MPSRRVLPIRTAFVGDLEVRYREFTVGEIKACMNPEASMDEQIASMISLFSEKVESVHDTANACVLNPDELTMSEVMEVMSSLQAPAPAPNGGSGSARR